MSIFPKPSPAPKPRTKDVRTVSIALAIIFVVMAVSQLFTFEEFVPYVVAVFGGSAEWAILAPVLIVAEIFALPFLLSMSVSKAFRWLSMLLSWVVVGIWAAIVLVTLLTLPSVDTIGFIGMVAPVVPGWWALCVVIAMALLVIWASWGNWPIASKPKKSYDVKKKRGE